MLQLQITNHAVERYRERVLNCSERQPSDVQLRDVIAKQIAFWGWDRLRGMIWWVKCGYPYRVTRRGAFYPIAPTHSFIVVDGVVVTTLGYGMDCPPEKQKVFARKARERRLDRLAEAYALRDQISNRI
jgi:hypothetical protein